MFEEKINKRTLPKMVFLLYFLFSACSIFSQTEFKFNSVSALVLIPNVGVEVGLSDQLSVQLDFSASFWDSFDGVPLQFVQIYPEVRYYPKSILDGFFVGGHVGFGMFTLAKNTFPAFIEKSDYPDDLYQSGRNTYYGLTVGYKKYFKQKWAYEVFVGGGTSQANYRGYSFSEKIRYDIPLDQDRNFNKSGEWLPYRGGVMLIYRIN